MGDVESIIFKLALYKINAASRWQSRIEKIALLLVGTARLYYTKLIAAAVIVPVLPTLNQTVALTMKMWESELTNKTQKRSPSSFTCAER